MAPLFGRSGHQLLTHVSKFAVVGAISTVLHVGLFAAATVAGWPSQASNAGALVLATVFNTAANRRWTFGVRGRAGLLRHHGQGLAVFAITWGVTAAALAVLAAVSPNAPHWLATTVLTAATAASTVLRFFALRTWMKPVSS